MSRLNHIFVHHSMPRLVEVASYELETPFGRWTPAKNFFSVEEIARLTHDLYKYIYTHTRGAALGPSRITSGYSPTAQKVIHSVHSAHSDACIPNLTYLMYLATERREICIAQQVYLAFVVSPHTLTHTRVWFTNFAIFVFKNKSL